MTRFIGILLLSLLCILSFACGDRVEYDDFTLSQTATVVFPDDLSPTREHSFRLGLPPLALDSVLRARGYDPSLLADVYLNEAELILRQPEGGKLTVLRELSLHLQDGSNGLTALTPQETVDAETGSSIRPALTKTNISDMIRSDAYAILLLVRLKETPAVRYEIALNLGFRVVVEVE